jgi:hypothetical protein
MKKFLLTGVAAIAMAGAAYAGEAYGPSDVPAIFVASKNQIAFDRTYKGRPFVGQLSFDEVIEYGGDYFATFGKDLQYIACPVDDKDTDKVAGFTKGQLVTVTGAILARRSIVLNLRNCTFD